MVYTRNRKTATIAFDSLPCPSGETRGSLPGVLQWTDVYVPTERTHPQATSFFGAHIRNKKTLLSKPAHKFQFTYCGERRVWTTGVDKSNLQALGSACNHSELQTTFLTSSKPLQPSGSISSMDVFQKTDLKNFMLTLNLISFLPKAVLMWMSFW